MGRALQHALLPLGEVIALGHGDVDLENLAGLDETLRAVGPNIVVNAAAYTAVDRAEMEEVAAVRVNAEAVAIMADHTRRHGALLVHYSTDYVFDGRKPEPYVEMDPVNPLSVYGKSKRMGEEAIIDSSCEALIFRTSWVYSAHGNNFIRTVLRLAREHESLDIVADQFGAPTAAELIAEITRLAIAAHDGGALSGGIYHLAAAGETSWHGLACHVGERARADGVTLKVKRINAIPTEAYPRPAARPRNSRLNTAELSAKLGYRFPAWQVHVDRVIDELVAKGFSE